MKLSPYTPTIVPNQKRLQRGDKIAVYGTLRKGQGNYNYLLNNDQSEYLGEAYVEGLLFSLGAGFPALVQTAFDLPTSHVKVDVFDVDESVGDKLDGLEGYDPKSLRNNFYIRGSINLLDTGEKVDIYYYQRNVQKDRFIPSGDWVEHRDRMIGKRT